MTYVIFLVMLGILTIALVFNSWRQGIEIDRLKDIIIHLTVQFNGKTTEEEETEETTGRDTGNEPPESPT